MIAGWQISQKLESLKHSEGHLESLENIGVKVEHQRHKYIGENIGWSYKNMKRKKIVMFHAAETRVETILVSRY